MSYSVWPHRWQPTRLPHPWDSPGKNTGVGCHFLLQCMKVKSEREVAQSCPTLKGPMDCSLPGSSVHGILQARVLEWGAISLVEIINACKVLNMVLLAHGDNPANASSSSSRNWWRMLRQEVNPPPDFKVRVFSLKHFGSPCPDFSLMIYCGQLWPIWISGKLPSPCSSYPGGFLFHSLDFYSWIICQRHGPRILTLNRFSSFNGPVLCCHPDTLPPLQPSAAGRKCL